MRTHTFLILLLATALAVTAAPVASAGHNDHHDGTAASEHRLNATERAERHAALSEARHAALDSFHENRTAALAAYHASLNATKTSFKENKTAVLADCHEAQNGYEVDGVQHCVRDGLKPLIEKARSEIKTAQQTLRAALAEARENAKASFQAARASANAKYGDA